LRVVTLAEVEAVTLVSTYTSTAKAATLTATATAYAESTFGDTSSSATPAAYIDVNRFSVSY
jgi:hypothetical protein